MKCQSPEEILKKTFSSVEYEQWQPSYDNDEVQSMTKNNVNTFTLLPGLVWHILAAASETFVAIDTSHHASGVSPNELF